MQVKRRNNETSEALIKRFTRKVKKLKIIEEYRERQYYKKPSEIAREAYFRRLAELENKNEKNKEKTTDNKYL